MPRRHAHGVDHRGVVALARLRENGERDAVRTIPLLDYVAAISVGIVDGEPLLRPRCTRRQPSPDVDMNIVKTGDGRLSRSRDCSSRSVSARGSECAARSRVRANPASRRTKKKPAKKPLFGHLVKVPRAKPRRVLRNAKSAKPSKKPVRIFACCALCVQKTRSGRLQLHRALSRLPIGDMLALAVEEGLSCSLDSRGRRTNRGRSV